MPARLCPRAQGQHWITAVAQLVCPDCQGKERGNIINTLTLCMLVWLKRLGLFITYLTGQFNVLVSLMFGLAFW